jgi:hypothetical protein
LSFFVLFFGVVVRAEYLATWIEGLNGEMPDLGFQSQIQDSKGNIWLFGGVSYTYIYPVYNHVWKLDVRNNYTWSVIRDWPVNDTGKYPPKRGMEGPDFRPSARSDALTWIDRNDNIWIYSGVKNYWTEVIDDFWMFNTTSLNWKLIHESMPAEWGTKGSGSYNVTFPGRVSGSVTWTDFESNELWFLAGSTELWRSDVWKYSIESGIWTWMAGPKEPNVPRTPGIEQGVWYSANQVTCPPVWAASGTVDSNGDVWFHGGNIPDYYLSNEMWRFRPSTLQWMWAAGNGTAQKAIVEEGHHEPAAADSGIMSYVGDGIILYWPGYVQSDNGYSDHLFSFNTSSMEWKFISGTLNNETYQAPSYGKFRQPDASNYPGVRGEIRSISRGCLWVVRGLFDWFTNAQHRDSFVFSVDICQNDLNPCDANAKCTAHIGYADCACKDGYEGDGYSCEQIVVPSSSSPVATSSPTSKTSTGANQIDRVVFASIIIALLSLIL